MPPFPTTRGTAFSADALDHMIREWHAGPPNPESLSDASATGVVITAIVQTTIAGAGLLIASIPAAGLIVAIVFMFCLAQIGPLPAMIPVLIWKFHSGDTLGGFLLLAFGLVAGTIDNVIRRLLIRKGADLPLVLVFAMAAWPKTTSR